MFCCFNPQQETEYPPTRTNTPETSPKITFSEMMRNDFTPEKINEINKKAQATFKGI